MTAPSFFRRSDLAATLWMFRRQFLLVGLLSFVSNMLLLSPTLYMLQVYDRVLSSQSELTLLALSLITLALFILMAVSDWARSRILVRAGVQFDRQLGTRVFNASFDSYLSQGGASPSRAFTDLLQIRQFLTGNGIFALFDAPWAPIFLVVTFFLHPVLGWVAIAFACVQVALAWFGHHGAAAPAEAASQATTQANTYLQGKLRNAEVLQAMGMIGSLMARWLERHRFALARTAQSHGSQHRLNAISKFVRYTQQSLTLAVGAILVIRGELSPGAMIAANVLVLRALGPIDQLVGAWRGFVVTHAAFLRLEQLLADHPERDRALSRVPPTGEIALRDVVATAPGRQQPILKGIGLDVRAGTVTAVLGPSGSGKSTLARVIVGIWPYVSGEVLLDGRPIGGWNRIELGPHLGYVPQDVELFEGSIAENISRFGELKSDKVIEAARGAGLHDMILRLPQGYDTPIGEAGGLLSAGQRQRVALARALYGNPALIVLDEPNANLDDAGEAALAGAIQRLKDMGKTVFLITHRPAALAAADQLLILLDGRIQAYGPRDQVLVQLRAPAQAAPTLAAQPA
ncbi:MAG: type I secretion system permease/ATPase [Pseudomonadota bacterium]